VSAVLTQIINKGEDCYGKINLTSSQISDIIEKARNNAYKKVDEELISRTVCSY
jgi:hypothetical protein